MEYKSRSIKTWNINHGVVKHGIFTEEESAVDI